MANKFTGVVIINENDYKNLRDNNQLDNTKLYVKDRYIAVPEIENSLTSEDENKPLSAKQGKTLKDLIDGITTIANGGSKAIAVQNFEEFFSAFNISDQETGLDSYSVTSNIVTQGDNTFALNTGDVVYIIDNEVPDYWFYETPEHAYYLYKLETSKVDLSAFLKITDISDWAKATTKPTYTASEVGAMASENPTGTGSFSLNRKAGSTVGNYSFVEGRDNVAGMPYAHAEGCQTTANGLAAHAEGYGTSANTAYQHVFGEYNIEDVGTSGWIPQMSKGSYIEIVGNGTSDTARSNARTLDWSGNEVLAGNITATGFKTSSGTSSQFLKADGSVDSNAYLKLSSKLASTDLNTIMVPGNYGVDASCTNKPGSLSGTLLVLNYNSESYYTQIFIDSSNYTFTRCSNLDNSSWSDWVKTATASELDLDNYVSLDDVEQEVNDSIYPASSSAVKESIANFRLTDDKEISDFYEEHSDPEDIYFLADDMSWQTLEWVVGKSITTTDVYRFITNIVAYGTIIADSYEYRFPYKSDVWAIIQNFDADTQTGEVYIEYIITGTMDIERISLNSNTMIFEKTKQQLIADKMTIQEVKDYVANNSGKIDTIKVNGTTQTITNKSVNINVPTQTSQLTNNSGFLTEHQDISGKANLTGGNTFSDNQQFNGLVYLEGSTPFFMSKKGKIGMRATNDSNENLGQMNISNAWYDADHYGSQMSARFKDDDGTYKYNAIRVSHNGPQYFDKTDTAHNLATEDYVDTKVSDLVASSPETLDTLNELATALGNDPNFATTMATELGKKANTADLKTVATSGSYDDLTNKPTIPDISVKLNVSAEASVPSTPTNLNTLYNAGLYGVKGVPLDKGAPTSTAFYGSVLVTPYNSTSGKTQQSYAGQLAFTTGDYTSGSNEGMWYRGSNSNTWNDWKKVATTDQIPIIYITGNTTGTAGVWTGTSSEITELKEGMVIAYKVGIAGASATTLEITNKNGTSLGAKRVYRTGTNPITTHYAVGTYIFVYYSTLNSGCFYEINGYDANSYAYMRMYNLATTDGDRDLVMRYDTTAISSGSNANKYGAITSAVALKANPKTGELKAVKFTENGTSLADKYQAKITDSNKLDYSLIDNTPTIPSAVTSVNGLSGGTISSAVNVNGYVTGTWLQTTATTDNANWTDVFVNSSGWLYKRSKDSFKSDLGIPKFTLSGTTLIIEK